MLARALSIIGAARSDKEIKRSAKLLAHMLRAAQLDKPRQFALLDAVHNQQIRIWCNAGRSRERAESDFDLLVSHLREELQRKARTG
jgi:hypothetical protein